MSTDIEQKLENYYKFLETKIFKVLLKISENSEIFEMKILEILETKMLETNF